MPAHCGVPVGGRGGLSLQPLLAQAPTGIGKTVGTLFPLLKAGPGTRWDKLFYLAAKTPGRQLALDALEKLTQVDTPRAIPLRVLERVARDRACEHPDKACHGDACPLARGFHDRLGDAAVFCPNRLHVLRPRRAVRSRRRQGASDPQPHGDRP